MTQQDNRPELQGGRAEDRREEAAHRRGAGGVQQARPRRHPAGRGGRGAGRARGRRQGGRAGAAAQEQRLPGDVRAAARRRRQGPPARLLPGGDRGQAARLQPGGRGRRRDPRGHRAAQRPQPRRARRCAWRAIGWTPCSRSPPRRSCGWATATASTWSPPAAGQRCAWSPWPTAAPGGATVTQGLDVGDRVIVDMPAGLKPDVRVLISSTAAR